jgi:5-methyltetrahydrofolate--homocysteine methyltransferase
MQTMKRIGRELPIMLSVTVSDLAGRTLSGQTLDAFLASVDSYPIFSIGLNCSFGAQQMKPFLKELAQRAPYYISAYPNAGLPNSMGLYDETPETMAPQIGEFIDEGLVNIVGGCCGTTPAFIERYVPLTIGKQPHKPAPTPQNLWLSGLDMLELTSDIPFVNVGERCNVAGSRKFLRLIKEKKYDEAIKGIDTTIENLTKIKESLRISAGHLSAANNKAEDLTIKKLTKGNPTMKAAFEKVRAEKAREEGPDEQ